MWVEEVLILELPCNEGEKTLQSPDSALFIHSRHLGLLLLRLWLYSQWGE